MQIITLQLFLQETRPVTDILPATQQKRHNYEQKFKHGNPNNFWYQDEAGIVSYNHLQCNLTQLHI